MSANIYWRPIPIKGNDISTRAPSHFIEMLKDAFGVFPVTLYKQHLPILRGMSIASSADTRDALNEIIKAIQNYEQIEVWAEY